MTALTWDDQPDLSRPVFLAAFEGWNDAAESATGAVDWLRHRWDAHRFARIDAQDYFDFRSIRPRLVLGGGVTRELRWPGNDFYAATATAGRHDAVLLAGTEPSFRWRNFCDDVLDVIRASGCEMVVTLGALLADVPHTRPVRITGTAGDDDLARNLGLERSRYEGPTGIVGVLHDACRRAGIPSVSLWAPVPHYVANPPNPAATLALLEAVGRLLESPAPAEELHAPAEAWQQKVEAAVQEDAETEAYVRELERRYDEQLRETDLPSGDDLAAQIQRFLADESDDDPGDAGDAGT